MYKGLQRSGEKEENDEKKAGSEIASIYAEYLFCRLKSQPTSVTNDSVKEAVSYARNYQTNPVRRAVTLDQLSNILSLMGCMDDSIKMGEEAGSLAEKNITSNSVAAQICHRVWQRTAELLVMKQLFKEAEVFYTKIAKIPRISDVNLALTWAGKALCLRNTERCDEAYDLLEKAEDVLSKEVNGEHPNLPFIYHLLGECAMKKASLDEKSNDSNWEILADKAEEWCHKCEKCAKRLGQIEVITQMTSVLEEIRCIRSRNSGCSE